MERTIPVRERKGSRFARLVTEALAPANVAGALLLVVAWHYAPSTRAALGWGLLAVLFVALMPISYVIREARRRKVTDHHVRLREQRPRLMVIGIAFVLVGLVLLVVLDAPQGLIALVGAMVGGLGSSILVTLFWKISIHVAVVSGAVTILILVFGPAMLLLAPLVALVAWARIDLQDHTPAQTIAGALLGAMAAGILFPLLS